MKKLIRDKFAKDLFDQIIIADKVWNQTKNHILNQVREQVLSQVSIKVRNEIEWEKVYNEWK